LTRETVKQSAVAAATFAKAVVAAARITPKAIQSGFVPTADHHSSYLNHKSMIPTKERISAMPSAKISNVISALFPINYPSASISTVADL
jgi:hypothetical protein